MSRLFIAGRSQAILVNASAPRESCRNACNFFFGSRKSRAPRSLEETQRNEERRVKGHSMKKEISIQIQICENKLQRGGYC